MMRWLGLLMLIVGWLSVSRHGVSGLDNGLARTPAMGWNSWNVYGCAVTEEDVRAAADGLVALGLLKLGYEYVNVDDCWQGERLKNGTITSNSTTFPSGIPALARYVHDKGLKFGLYSDAGSRTCEGKPGSLGFETVDATAYASWGVDYVKYDNCNVEGLPVQDRFVVMSRALNASGRPILFSLSGWGIDNPWDGWGPAMANSWRTAGDLKPDWDIFLRVADNSLGLSRFAGPGGWNDMDMLEVGNGGLSDQDQHSHFAIWAAMKSPLLIGTNLANITKPSLGILGAQELIAVNQDALGVPADIIYQRGPEIILAGPLADGSRVVLLWTRHANDNVNYHYNMTVEFAGIGYPAGTEAVVRDLYTRQDLGTFADHFVGNVPHCGILALKVSPVSRKVRKEGAHWRPWDVYTHLLRSPVFEGA